MVIFDDCHTEENRCGSEGCLATGITALNLKTGASTQIANGDLTHQYQILAINKNQLYYEETSVADENDWNLMDMDKQHTTNFYFDLTKLEAPG
jgi:hypothetical protein